MSQPNIAISLDQVSKSYPGVEALRNVSFSVREKSIHAFLGPNGAGKSTTMKIITGLIPATEGKVTVSSKIGFLPENPPLYLSMQVKPFLEFVYRIQNLKVRDSTRVFDLDLLMEKTGLTSVSERLIGNLSKGYRQRVGIAQALCANPGILILDEPTVGLDPQAMEEILRLITSLKDDHTILLSSHQLHEVEQVCTDVTIIQQGEIVSTGTFEQIRKKIQTTQLFKTKLRSWIPDWSEALAKQFGINIAEQSQLGSEFHVSLSTSRTGDQRESVLKYLVEQGAGVLEFSEQRPDLEEIFKQVTKKRLVAK